MKKKERSEFILKQPLSSIVWKLSLPAIAAMVLFGLNAFLDAIFVGQLIGSTALAGVALAYPLSNLMMGLGSWIGTGAGNVLSIAIGANDEDLQKKIVGSSTFTGFLFSAVFTSLAWIFAPFLIESMGGTGEILDIGVRYFRISILGTVFWIYALTLNMIIRGEGKMLEAAKMMGVGLLVNIVLNPIFISVFDWGVEGAAWATTVGMIVYSVLGYRYFLLGRASFPSNIKKIVFDHVVIRLILKTGLPGFVMTSMSLVQAFVIFNAITDVGTEEDVAFFAACHRVLLFMMTPLFGLMRALQPVLGINYGAGNFDRVKQGFNVFTWNGLLIIAPFWLAMNVFPDITLRLMLPDMTLTVQQLNYFRIYIFVLPILPFVFNALTYFPAIGSPRKASLVALARQIVFYVPVMLVLPKLLGLSGVYIGGAIIDIVVTIWMIFLVWKSMRELKEKEDPVLYS